MTIVPTLAPVIYRLDLYSANKLTAHYFKLTAHCLFKGFKGRGDLVPFLAGPSVCSGLVRSVQIWAEITDSKGAES